MNAPPPGDREEAARARRDRWALRLFLGACALLLGAYAVADAHGIVPRELSVRWRTQQRGRLNLDGRYTEFDPDLCLGIAIGDTRYRFNYASYHAIVTRPLFGVRRWVIPEEVRYEGDVFTVTALDPFALLNAPDAETVSLPPTLRHTNGAEALAGKTLRTLTLRLPDGTARDFPSARGFDEATLRRTLGLPPDTSPTETPTP